MKKYQVINHEQHGEDVWSTHSTRKLAEAAKRRYERRNPITVREPSLAFEIREIESEA
jgi:hypothetical protein